MCHLQVNLKTVLADKAYILFYNRRPVPVPLPLVANVSCGAKARTAARTNSCSRTGEGPEGFGRFISVRTTKCAKGSPYAEISRV